MELEAAVGIAVSIVVALLSQWKNLPGGAKYILVIVLSAAGAMVLTGEQWSAEAYLRTLAVVVGSAVTARQIAKPFNAAITSGGANL